MTAAGQAICILTDEPNALHLAIFDSVPPWAIAHAARDGRTAPLILEGEVAVVESDGCKGHIPEDGGLYLIENVSPPHSALYGYERRTGEIVQICKGKRGDWYAHPYARFAGHQQALVMSDGPYQDETMLAEKVLGRVVGIYRPSRSGDPS